MKYVLTSALCCALMTGSAFETQYTITPGSTDYLGVNVRNFQLTAQVLCSEGAHARLSFHTDQTLRGYQILFQNGEMDGSRKTGSLSHVRNLYRSLAQDNVPFLFTLTVRGQNIEVKIGSQTVVNYTEPENPWRLEAYRNQRLSQGDISLYGVKGSVKLSSIKLEKLATDERNPGEIKPFVDEQIDRTIRKQQIDFPVIDYHVHLKGGLTKELAEKMSFATGITYGVAPNVYGPCKKGEGGYGDMFENDKTALAYLNDVRPAPFICGAQGEGRKWGKFFSKECLLQFDYLFTDSMTIVDKGEHLRLYHPKEVKMNGRSKEAWMDFLVSQIERILTCEPADIYANSTFLPPEFNKNYDAYWTDARVERLLNVLVKEHIALEINSHYRIPNARIIRMAKVRGVKFTFGTNNQSLDQLGHLEYSLDMVDVCGLTKEDMWFPAMSVRSQRNYLAEPPQKK